VDYGADKHSAAKLVSVAGNKFSRLFQLNKIWWYLQVAACDALHETQYELSSIARQRRAGNSSSCCDLRLLLPFLAAAAVGRLGSVTS
jgi:hypothetical protein